MKSTLVLVGAFAACATAVPHYSYNAECADQPIKTITVTNSYAPEYTGGAGQEGEYGGSAVTVTVTATAPVQTITEVVTYTQATHLPPTYSGTSAIYSNTTSAAAAHKTHHVDVGTFNGKVQFIPNTVNAAIGDVVEYNFLAKSHSLTQSNFATPCTFNGGFDTGLNQPNPNNITGLHIIPFTVNTTSPQWFYCKQQGPPNHCGAGMVFGLNPKSPAQMDQFVANAVAQNGHLTGTSSSPTAAATATAAPIPTVTVGLDAGKTLRFSPAYLPHVPAGSKIHFDFRALNHTLTESSLENPCSKLNPEAIDTAFQNANPMDVPGLKPFELEITGTEPRFFYCRQGNGTPNGHCGKGMVFAVNVDGGVFGEFERNAVATLPVVRRGFRA